MRDDAGTRHTARQRVREGTTGCVVRRLGLLLASCALLTGCGVLANLDAGGTTPLMATATAGTAEDGAAEATRLLAAGADVDEQNDRGVTALMEAAGNRPAVLRVLLAHGADVSLRDGDGWTALTYATFRQDPDSTRLLLQAGATDVRPSSGELAGFSTCEIARARSETPLSSSSADEQAIERADRAEVERLICGR
jgi:ankyrin repeat protein